MMDVLMHLAQVRRENFSDEIPDGISSGPIVLYRTCCQDDAERSGYEPKLSPVECGLLSRVAVRVNLRGFSG
jgi:hypothetical protein